MSAAVPAAAFGGDSLPVVGKLVQPARAESAAPGTRALPQRLHLKCFHGH